MCLVVNSIILLIFIVVLLLLLFIYKPFHLWEVTSVEYRSKD